MIDVLVAICLFACGPDIDGRLADLIARTDDDAMTELDQMEMRRLGWLQSIYVIIDNVETREA